MPPYAFKIHFSGHEEVAYYEAHEGKLLGADVYFLLKDLVITGNG